MSGTDTPGGRVSVYAPTAAPQATAGADGRYSTTFSDTNAVGRPYGIDVVSMSSSQMIRLQVTCPRP